VKVTDGVAPVALIHGGDLSRASQTFGVAKERWIDLSTGISPWSWLVPAVPEIVWQSLPYAGDGLESAASDYYGCDARSLLAVPGSQYAIQCIPALIPKGAVAMPVRGYAEHRLSWFKAGHDIVDYDGLAQLQQLVSERRVKHVVVINPNNPTSEMIVRQQLMEILQQLQVAGGWLLVDEAFMDGVPENSLVPECPKSGLVILRSIGKFFGLAGLRLGFVMAPPVLLQKLDSQSPPWHVSHPARWVAKQALADFSWQRIQRQRLEEVSLHWCQVLTERFSALEFSGSLLFVTGRGEAESCEAIYQELGKNAVLVRLFDEIKGQRMVRFGLPGERNMPKVAAILQQATAGQ